MRSLRQRSICNQKSPDRIDNGDHVIAQNKPPTALDGESVGRVLFCSQAKMVS